VQQDELSDLVLGDCVGARVCRVGFCFGLGFGEEGGGGFFEDVLEAAGARVAVFPFLHRRVFKLKAGFHFADKSISSGR
jgi:hypothetical protein